MREKELRSFAESNNLPVRIYAQEIYLFTGKTECITQVRWSYQLTSTMIPLPFVKDTYFIIVILLILLKYPFK